jgi:hypothetical protein
MRAQLSALILLLASRFALLGASQTLREAAGHIGGEFGGASSGALIGVVADMKFLPPPGHHL